MKTKYFILRRLTNNKESDKYEYYVSFNKGVTMLTPFKEKAKVFKYGDSVEMSASDVKEWKPVTVKKPKEDKSKLADNSKVKLYKQRAVEPYYTNEKGKLKTVFNIRGKAGVYMIYKNGVLRYVGYASDIYKTMYHHLGKQTWKNSPQYRASYEDLTGITVRVVYTRTKEIAKRLEAGLIFKYNPPDNFNKYEDFEPDDKEREIVHNYIDAETKPIAEFTGDLPF